MSEKVGGAEGTKLDDDFTDMEKARPNYFHDPHFDLAENKKLNIMHQEKKMRISNSKSIIYSANYTN